jgi:hypothetical protein
MGGQQLTVQQGVALHCCGNANGTTNVGKRKHHFTTLFLLTSLFCSSVPASCSSCLISKALVSQVTNPRNFHTYSDISNIALYRCCYCFWLCALQRKPAQH